MFTLLLGCVAFLIAGCAAFFSVLGLATLYSSKYIAVCIMAGGLEIGKLVAASFLHRYWNITGWMLKTYLTLAVVVLMAITSLGIFGFLTSAYQQSHVKVEMIDAKKESILSNKETLENENINLIKRIETLNQVRLVQEQRVKDSGNYKVPREQAYEAINKANQEINQSQDRIKQISEEINKLNQELINLKYEESKSSDIGTLKFVAELFNTEISTIVKWFTIILVLVFDPLAVSLVLAYNNIIFNKKKESKIIEDKLENSLSEKIIKRIKKPFKVKYQDK